MISYAELEFAIARWKARVSGVPQPMEPAASGTVEAEVPVPTAPEEPTDEAAGTVAEEAAATVGDEGAAVVAEEAAGTGTDDAGEYASGSIDLTHNNNN